MFLRLNGSVRTPSPSTFRACLPRHTKACVQYFATVAIPLPTRLPVDRACCDSTHLVALIVSFIYVFLLPYLLHTRISLIRCTPGLHMLHSTSGSIGEHRSVETEFDFGSVDG
jgi:hypothetical protein